MKTPKNGLGLDARFSANIKPSAGEPVIEIRDHKYADRFGPAGQFVSSYYARTLAEFGTGSLVLDGGIPEWTLSPIATDRLVRFAKEWAEVANS